MTKLTKQVVIVEQSTLHDHQLAEAIALFNPDGSIYAGRRLESLVVLSAEDILSLDTVPVEIVPAPGVGKFLFPVLINGVMFPGERVFFGEASKIWFRFPDMTDPSAVIGQFQTEGLIDAEEPVIAYENTGGTSHHLLSVVENQPLQASLYSGSYRAGAIDTYSLNAGGSDYVVGDTGTVTPSVGPVAEYMVDAIGVGGAVTDFHIGVPGGGFDVSTDNVTETAGNQPGIGVGLTFDIESVIPGNGSLILIVSYEIREVPRGYVS